MPAHLLFFIERTEELIGIAHVLQSRHAHRPDAIIESTGSDGPDISDTQVFTGPYANRNPWESFPRNLTEDQYHYPYKALQKFCKLMPKKKWHEVLRNLTEYALSNMTINEECTLHEMLTIRKRLLQMLEAFHLVHIRITTAIKKEE